MGRKPHEMDSGWSWILVVGFLISSFLLGGFIKAFGVFFAAFATTFEASASTTSLIIGVRAAMSTIIAPLAAIMSERYSERMVLIGSGLFCSLGALIAAFAPNMEMVVFATGFIMGIGVSSFFAPVQIAIGKYFDKRKSIAVSLSFVGMCLAQIVMAPVNIIFLETYALRGTLMLYAGFLLHTIVAGALVRPVKATHRSYVDIKPELQEKKALSMIELASVQDLYASREFIKNMNANGSKVETSPLTRRTRSEFLRKEDEVAPVKSVGDRQGHSETNGGYALDPQQKSQKVRSRCVRILRSIKHVLDFSLLKNPTFAMYALAQCSSQVAFNNVPVYLFPRAEDYGLTANESALLLTITGCTDLISRILQGIFGDAKGVGPRVVFTCGIFCFGISTAVIPLTTNFLEMAIVSGFLGLFSSSTIVLNMPILVEIVGLEKLSKAVALTSFFNGITNAAAPPLLGYIKDVTTSYNYVYVACAGILFLATAFMVAESTIRFIARKCTG